MSSFKFKPFSEKQLKVLTWWHDNSPVKDMVGVISDGAIRSGKTLIMSLSFAMWAMENFKDQNFAMCGKTIGSFRRNVLFWLKIMLVCRGYAVVDRRADNLLEVYKGERVNYFYIFGGKDERSQDLIQGITLAGVFFDEVALMPQSFVNQATGRCSVDGSKFWFNCNPDGPYHWFKLNWIDKAIEKRLLRLHFTMEDNNSLTERVKERYRAMYSGVFFQRYILGLWRAADGLIYDMFNEDRHIITALKEYTEYYVSVDYGTQNATSFHLWGKADKQWHAIKEYYYSGRTEQKQKTDREYADDLEAFTDGYKIRRVVIDPSAASFIAEIRSRGYRIKKGDNDVLDGIRTVATLLNQDIIAFDKSCINTLKEFSSYTWDEKATNRGVDQPIKENDHAMDSVRYMCYTIIRRKSGMRVL